jgi:hypothetical protein
MSFLVCIHDATPAYARETEVMIRDLAPLVGRNLSCGVVPNWHGAWPLEEHHDYCSLVRESSSELLLHGYYHARSRGAGPVSLIAERCDEMNGLGPDETGAAIQRGQDVFAAMFGAPAPGFLAPGWQRGHVRAASFGIEHVLGFFTLQSARAAIPLATSTWDCGRWSWLGLFGDGLGRISQSLTNSVPALAIHPRDIGRGFWPRVLRLTRELLDAGHEPTTPGALIASR